MLCVGIDWGETTHAACLASPTEVILDHFTLPHSPAGIRQLQQAIAAHEPDPAAVLVALERPDGLLVTALLGCGYTLYALNPKAVDRYRDRFTLSGAKSDSADAELLARILATDRGKHRALTPRSEALEELRAIAREDEQASHDEQRLRNQLRAELLAVFPAALDAFALDRVLLLHFLLAWPTATAAATVDVAELDAFCRRHNHSRPHQAAVRAVAALQQPALVARPALVRAKAGAIALLVRQVLLLHEQRRAWQQDLRRLLTSEDVHPDGEVLLSLPGMDVVLAARVWGEIGTLEAYPTAAALQCYAGTAPVTRQSGKTRLALRRLAYNTALHRALLCFARCSVVRSGWAKAYLTEQQRRGKRYRTALRALANRWVEILHYLLRTHTRYDEAVHARNRAAPPLPTAA
jgi:transposase